MRLLIILGLLILIKGIYAQNKESITHSNRIDFMEEYLLSNGDVHPEMFEKALSNIQQDEKYFTRIGLEKVLSNLKSWYLANESEQIQNQ